MFDTWLLPRSARMSINAGMCRVRGTLSTVILTSCSFCLSSQTGPAVLPEPQYYLDVNDPPIAGDIFRMQESVRTPIRHILAQSPGQYNGSASLAFTHASTTRTSGTMKTRPCIIVNLPEEETRRSLLSICAMATYEGVPIHEAPEIYQHFSIGISPNTSDPVHLHTSPEWTGVGGQWVIAYIYGVPPDKYDLWTTPRRYNRYSDGPIDCYSYHRLSNEMLQYLVTVNREKLQEWQRMCLSDPDLLSRSLKQVRAIICISDDRIGSLTSGMIHLRLSYDDSIVIGQPELGPQEYDHQVSRYEIECYT